MVHVRDAMLIHHGRWMQKDRQDVPVLAMMRLGEDVHKRLAGPGMGLPDIFTRGAHDSHDRVHAQGGGRRERTSLPSLINSQLYYNYRVRPCLNKTLVSR
jgi:hypothetical protein